MDGIEETIMKLILPAMLAAIAAAACAGTSTSAPTTPNLSEQQVLLGARAGDTLPNGAETYVDGENVDGSKSDQLDQPQR
jgi:hypothetical protein